MGYDRGKVVSKRGGISNQPLPQDVATERVVLGACLVSPAAVVAALEKLTPNDFYSPANSAIFKSITELFADNKPVDITSVADKLAATPYHDRASALDLCGGRLYLVSLVESVHTDKNASYHSAIIKEKSVRRNLIETGWELVGNAFNEFKKNEEIIVEGENRLLACAGIQGNGTAPGRVSFFDHYDSVAHQAIPTGFQEFDRIAGGLNKGDPIIVAARPGLGKTSLLLQMLRNMAKGGYKVLYFTYETTVRVLVERIIVGELGIDRYQLRHKRLVSQDSTRFINACADGGVLHRIENHILIDESRPTAKEFPLRLRLYKSKFPFDVVLLDYIQLLAGSEENKDVAAASKVVSFAAKDHNVPIVVASQFHRQKDERYDPRPKLSDLRGSGALEQDARMVVLLWNPCAPLRQAIDLTEGEQNKVEEWRDKVRFILGKNNEGDIGEWDLGWEGKYSRFYSIQPERSEPLF